VGGGHEKLDLSTNLRLLGKLSTQPSISTQVPQHFAGMDVWTIGGTIGRGCGRLVMSLDVPGRNLVHNDENHKLLCMHLDLVNLHMNISFH